MRAASPLFALLLLSDCVGQPAPPPLSRPHLRELPPPPVPLAAAIEDWRDRLPTPGDWVYRHDAEGSIALFGTRGADALLTLRCDRPARRLYLSRRDEAPPARPGASPMLVIRTSSMTGRLSTQRTGGDPPYVAVSLAPTDPLLDAIGFSRGHFLVEAAGWPSLIVPAWAEILRVTEDCRA